MFIASHARSRFKLPACSPNCTSGQKRVKLQVRICGTSEKTDESANDRHDEQCAQAVQTMRDAVEEIQEWPTQNRTEQLRFMLVQTLRHKPRTQRLVQCNAAQKRRAEQSRAIENLEIWQ